MKHFVLLVILHYYKKLYRETFCSLKLKYETFCSVKVQYETFRSNDIGVDYVTYVPKIENNTIKIGHFIHKCKFSTFIILDGCKSRIIRNSIKLIISLNLSTSNKKI